MDEGVVEGRARPDDRIDDEGRVVDRADDRGDGGDRRPARAADVFEGRVEAVGLDQRGGRDLAARRSEEHTSELQSLMRTSYAVFCLKKKNHEQQTIDNHPQIN